VNFHVLWRESGEVLAEKSNRLTLILAIMVAVSPLPIYHALPAVGSALIEQLPGKEAIVYAITALFMFSLTLFFSLPLLCGLPRMASEMEQGREVLLQDVFQAFSDRRSYRLSLRVSFSVLWRILLLCGVEIALFRFTFFLAKGTVTVLILGIPLSIGGFVLWFWIAMRGFLLTYFAYRTANKPERMQSYALSAATHYGMGFLPWIVLSLLTLGILFLADTLPRMLIAYFRLCNKLNEITTRSEEI